MKFSHALMQDFADRFEARIIGHDKKNSGVGLFGFVCDEIRSSFLFGTVDLLVHHSLIVAAFDEVLFKFSKLFFSFLRFGTNSDCAESLTINNTFKCMWWMA